MMNKIVVNKSSVKVRRQRFRKCKCPFRKKYRDEREKNKREWTNDTRRT